MNASDHVIRFCEKLHLAGDFRGERFVARDFQKQILKPLFATDESGNRAIRRALLMLPRKSGKTYLCACLSLYALLTFGKSQCVLSAAASQKQARHVFDAMREIIEQDATLSSLCQVYRGESRIVVPSQGSYFVSVSSGGKTAHGHNPTVVIIDELHAWTKPTHRELFAALTTGRGARKNPLTIMISTQTADRFSLAGEEFEYACKLKNRMVNGEVIAEGTVENPHYLAALYYLPHDADWHDESLWQAVSPALNDYLDIEEYREQHKQAVDIPSRATFFKTLYLNMPADDSNRWMDYSQWSACKWEATATGKTQKDLETLLEGKECWAALDLAPVSDLTSLNLLVPFEGKLYALSYNWCNAADINERTKIDKVHYDRWRDAGYITETPGSTTDFEFVERDIIALSKRFRIKLLVADQTYAHSLGLRLQSAGIKIDWFRQGFISYGPATARTLKLVLDKRLVHPGNPVLDYCMHNLRCETDAAGNQKPSNKLRLRHEKIDSACSLIMSVGVWMQTEGKGESVYERRARMAKEEAAKAAAN